MIEIPYIQNTGVEHHAPRAAMLLTASGHDSARQAQVTGIEADLPAMEAIARHIGFIGRDAELPPLFFLARDFSPARSVITNWDTLAPRDAGSPLAERYFWATDVRDDRPRSSERAQLIEMARAMGAAALTEISIKSWNDKSTFARSFAAGLLTGQRPLEVMEQPKPSILTRIGREFAGTLSGQAGKAFRLIGEIDKMAKSDTPIAPPFVIHRGTLDLAHQS